MKDIKGIVDNVKVKSVHSWQELLSLDSRKSYKKICTKIHAEYHKKAEGLRVKTTKEEYLTRYLMQKRKFLCDGNEMVLIDKYPLRKHPARGKVADIIYCYNKNGVYKLGLVEAKIKGGDPFEKALEQAILYTEIFHTKLLEKRQLCMKGIADKLHGIELSSNSKISRIDILAPEDWWKTNRARIGTQKITEILEYLTSQSIEFRPLSIPGNWFPESISVERTSI